MRHLGPQISKFSWGACPGTPLDHMSARRGVYKFFQKSAPPPSPRLSIAVIFFKKKCQVIVERPL